MKLLGAKLRGIFAKFFEALSLSFAKATKGSPRLYPRSIRQRTDQPWLKLCGIWRRRMKNAAQNWIRCRVAQTRRAGKHAGRGWALDPRIFARGILPQKLRRLCFQCSLAQLRDTLEPYHRELTGCFDSPPPRALDAKARGKPPLRACGREHKNGEQRACRIA